MAFVSLFSMGYELCYMQLMFLLYAEQIIFLTIRNFLSTHILICLRSCLRVWGRKFQNDQAGMSRSEHFKVLKFIKKINFKVQLTKSFKKYFKKFPPLAKLTSCTYWLELNLLSEAFFKINFYSSSILILLHSNVHTFELHFHHFCRVCKKMFMAKWAVVLLYNHFNMNSTKIQDFGKQMHISALRLRRELKMC